MKHVSLKIRDELHAKSIRLSAERGTPKSEVIRDAPESYFAGANGAKVSCADLAGDLIGSLAGPANLATNPKHLSGYGQ